MNTGGVKLYGWQKLMERHVTKLFRICTYRFRTSSKFSINLWRNFIGSKRNRNFWLYVFLIANRNNNFKTHRLCGNGNEFFRIVFTWNTNTRAQHHLLLFTSKSAPKKMKTTCRCYWPHTAWTHCNSFVDLHIFNIFTGNCHNEKSFFRTPIKNMKALSNNNHNTQCHFSCFTINIENI